MSAKRRLPASKVSGWPELARLDPVGLALPERVVEMLLAVARTHAVAVDCHDRVADALAVSRALEEPRDDVHAVVAGDADQLPHERPVDILRGGGEGLVERVDEVARVLREQHDARAAGGGGADERLDDVQVGGGVGGRRDWATAIPTASVDVIRASSAFSRRWESPRSRMRTPRAAAAIHDEP